MWDWWESLSNRAQTVSKGIAAIVVMCSMALGAVNYFQTDAEAQDYRQRHQSELVRVRIQQIETLISQYRYQLLSAQLTPQQREWINTEIAKLTKQIECIRAGQC